jgi:hypothetical protein
LRLAAGFDCPIERTPGLDDEDRAHRRGLLFAGGRPQTAMRLISLPEYR